MVGILAGAYTRGGHIRLLATLATRRLARCGRPLEQYRPAVLTGFAIPSTQLAGRAEAVSPMGEGPLSAVFIRLVPLRKTVALDLQAMSTIRSKIGLPQTPNTQMKSLSPSRNLLCKVAWQV